MNDERKNGNFDEILAKENPDLFLTLNKSKTESKLPTSILSQPVKLILCIVAIDLIIGFLLSILEKTSHFLMLSGRLWISLPWWIACLDGFIFVGYGIYVIVKKRGQLDSSSSSSDIRTVKEIRGDASGPLGLLYILLGIFLLIVVAIQFLI